MSKIWKYKSRISSEYNIIVVRPYTHYLRWTQVYSLATEVGGRPLNVSGIAPSSGLDYGRRVGHVSDARIGGVP